MAYTPTEWVTGDVITAAKLNKAEQGIAAAFPFIVNQTVEGSVETLSKTWKEITDAMAAGKSVFLLDDQLDGDDSNISYFQCLGGFVSEGVYYVQFLTGEADPKEYSIDSETGYPYYDPMG